MFSYIRLDIRVVYIRSHLTSSPLLPNFQSPQCVAGKFPISHRYLWFSYDVAFIHDIRDVMFSFNLTLPRYWPISDLTQLSVTPVISMFSYILLDIYVVYIRSHFTSSPLLPNFPTLQCIAGKFLISQRYLWYSYDVAFIHDIRDVMFSFHLTLPHYYSISDFTHPLWHPWCQWSTSSQLISIMIKSPIFAGVAESWLEHQISHLRSA